MLQHRAHALKLAASSPGDGAPHSMRSQQVADVLTPCGLKNTGGATLPPLQGALAAAASEGVCGSVFVYCKFGAFAAHGQQLHGECVRLQ